MRNKEVLIEERQVSEDEIKFHALEEWKSYEEYIISTYSVEEQSAHRLFINRITQEQNNNPF
jgi:hypothetical protein